MDWEYTLGLILQPKIDGCRTVGELLKKGCPICSQELYIEASTGFGSLWCREHGIIHKWLPSRSRIRYWTHASKVYKNHITGKTSKEWDKIMKGR